MIRSLITISLVFVYCLTFSQDIPERPKPPRLVNDFANMLGKSEQIALERKLIAYNDTTSTQIVVVILSTIAGYDISDYSFKLGEKWGIGQKGKDNGVLILIAAKDRKMFISTGYGMEGVLPDALAKRIVEVYMKPNFRNKNYFKGIDEATSIIMGLASGQYTADGIGRRKVLPMNLIFPLLLLLFFILPYFRYRKARGSHYGGSNLGFWTFLMLMSASSGGRSGFGSFSSGSGSFGGGGFSGFGGGSFGGGGAGGSW